MKTLKFYGASDDLFESECPEDGRFTDEQDNCADGTTMAYRVTDAGGAGLFVTATYAPAPLTVPCWVIGITLLDEDVALPAWPMRWETAERAYSPMLVIEAPDDVTVTVVER